MTRVISPLHAVALMNAALLAYSRPISNTLEVRSSNSSWEDWSATYPTPSNTTMPDPNMSPINGSQTSVNTTPAYANPSMTLDDVFTIDYFPDFNFTSTSPEPYDPSLPNPDGPLMERMAEDEADIPAYLKFANSTASNAKLTTNINDILESAGLTSANSVIADGLISSLNGSASPMTAITSDLTASEREMTLFLQSCLLDYDSCLFWDADTMEVVDATMAIAGTDLWETRDENESVWPIIAQWVLNFGVDILVGDRSITNEMVLPVTILPGGKISSSLPVRVLSVSGS